MKKIYFVSLLLIPVFLYGKSSVFYSIHTVKKNNAQGRYEWQYPKLNSGFAKESVVKALNQKLKKRFVQSWLCEKDKAKAKDMYIRTILKVTYLSDKLLSTRVYYKGYCGGPYPDSGVIDAVFSLPSMKRLTLDEMIKDKKAYNAFFSGELKAQQPPHLSKNCLHLYKKEEMNYYDLSFHLSKKAIVLRKSFPHVARACEYDIKVPCQRILLYLEKNKALSDFCSVKKR